MNAPALGIPTPAATRRFAPSAVAALIVIGLIASICVATWQRAQFERAQALDAATRTTANLAIAYESDALDIISDVHALAKMVASSYRREGRAFDIPPDWPIDSALVEGLLIVAPDGGIALRHGRTEGIEARAREEASLRTAAGGAMRIGNAFRGPDGTRWLFLAMLPISGDEGRRAGTVVVIVNAAILTNFQRKVDLGHHGVVSLVNTDTQRALVRHIGAESAFDVDMSASTLLARQRQQPSGSFAGLGKLDGITRIYVYRTLSQYPFVVLVGIDEAEALAATRHRARLYYLLAALA